MSCIKHCYILMDQQMHIYGYVQSHIVFLHNHISVMLWPHQCDVYQ